MKRRLLVFIILSHFNFMSHGQSIILDGSFTHSTSWVWFSILTVDSYYASDAGTATQEGPVHFADSIGGCMGLRFYSPTDDDWQEYIYQNITGAMHPDTTYLVSLKYLLAPACSTATNFMGVGFLKGYTHSSQITEQVLRAKDPEVHTSGTLMDNNLTYRELKGYYTATGDETFFAIGSFQTDDEIERLPVSAIYPGYQNYQKATILYFIDDVKIIPCNDYPPDPLPEKLIYCNEQTVQINAPAVVNGHYLWSTGDTTQSITVDAQNQHVWLEITKNGCVRSDTLELRVFSGEVDLGEDRLVCTEEAFPITFSSHALPGEAVLWNTGSTADDLVVSEQGTYWVEKTVDDCFAGDTITVTQLAGFAHLYPNPVKDHFSMTHADHANILNIRTEDGKWIFKGVASMESMEEFVGKLAPAVYFLTTEIEGCILEERIVKMNE